MRVVKISLTRAGKPRLGRRRATLYAEPKIDNAHVMNLVEGILNSESFATGVTITPSFVTKQRLDKLPSLRKVMDEKS